MDATLHLEHIHLLALLSLWEGCEQRQAGGEEPGRRQCWGTNALIVCGHRVQTGKWDHKGKTPPNTKNT